MPSTKYRFLYHCGACKYCGFTRRHYDWCPIGKEVGLDRLDPELEHYPAPEVEEDDEDRLARYYDE